MRKLYYIFAIGVIGAYATFSWMGWEFANAGRARSVVGVPFIAGRTVGAGGYRGGK